MKANISTRSIVAVLFAVTVVLVIAHIASVASAYFLDSEEIFPLFNLALDSNVPTWFSSFLLLLCSIVLFVIGASNRNNSLRYGRHWTVLGGIFLLMSVDEVARIHETIPEAMGSAVVEQVPSITESSPLYYSTWMIPGAIFVILVGVLYARFVLDLPTHTKRGVLVAGAIYLLGAMGMEAVGDVIIASSDGVVTSMSGRMALVVATTMEETLEMLGLLVLLYTLLVYAGRYTEPVTVEIGK